MLTIVVPPSEFFDEVNEKFIYTEGATLQLMHSLVSLSKWEAKWEKPFLTNTSRTDEETIDYVRCMCLTPDVPPEVFHQLSRENNEQIATYIQAKMTATWFNERPGQGPPNREIITAEIIYYWMNTLSIEKAYEDWHLNRLLTLIRVINEKNKPKKKMPKADAAQQRHALNEARKQQLGSNG